MLSSMIFSTSTILPPSLLLYNNFGFFFNRFHLFAPLWSKFTGKYADGLVLDPIFEKSPIFSLTPFMLALILKKSPGPPPTLDPSSASCTQLQISLFALGIVTSVPFL